MEMINRLFLFLFKKPCSAAEFKIYIYYFRNYSKSSLKIVGKGQVISYFFFL